MISFIAELASLVLFTELGISGQTLWSIVGNWGYEMLKKAGYKWMAKVGLKWARKFGFKWAMIFLKRVGFKWATLLLLDWQEILKARSPEDSSYRVSRINRKTLKATTLSKNRKDPAVRRRQNSARPIPLRPYLQAA